MPRLIDAHTHAQFAAYGDGGSEVIGRALDNDIWLVNVGTQIDTSKDAINAADNYKEGVYASVGLHPIHTGKSYHDIQELGGGDAEKEFTSRGEKFDYDAYKKLAQHPKTVSIGECGLDYYRTDPETKKIQEEVFINQIELANEVGKPLMIHCRDAFQDLIKILGANSNKLKADGAGIIHFFTGSVNDAAKLLNLGFYFSFGGVITFTHDYDEAIRRVSLDRIVVETDAPYVAPVPFRGKRNEPSYVIYPAEKLAEIMGVGMDEIAKKTTENARKIFNI